MNLKQGKLKWQRKNLKACGRIHLQSRDHHLASMDSQDSKYSNEKTNALLNNNKQNDTYSLLNTDVEKSYFKLFSIFIYLFLVRTGFIIGWETTWPSSCPKKHNKNGVCAWTLNSGPLTHFSHTKTYFSKKVIHRYKYG